MLDLIPNPKHIHNFSLECISFRFFNYLFDLLLFGIMLIELSGYWMIPTDEDGDGQVVNDIAGESIDDDGPEFSHVWYACYGSNMYSRRFMCYIKGGRYASKHLQVQVQAWFVVLYLIPEELQELKYHSLFIESTKSLSRYLMYFWQHSLGSEVEFYDEPKYLDCACNQWDMSSEMSEHCVKILHIETFDTNSMSLKLPTTMGELEFL